MNKKQEKQFDNEFGEESGIYYGKDIDGDRIFIPNGALEPIKQFISTTLKTQRKEIMNDLKKKVKDMPENFPELESDIYDIAYKEAKEYLLKLLK